MLRAFPYSPFCVSPSAGWWMLLALWGLAAPSVGQIRFSGLGRTVFQDQSIHGRALENDSLSDRRTQQGYTLFDLRAQYQWKERFSFLAEYRVKNVLGGFGGVGISSEIRQIRIEGLLSRFVKYAAGDVDVRLSPFLFWNYDDPLAEGEGPLFAFRRNIIRYENFNVDHHWRMRGVVMQSRFPIWQKRIWVEALAFGVTDRSYTRLSDPVPGRIGGSLALAGKGFRLEGMGVRHEVPQDSGGKMQNQVAGIKARYSVFPGKVKLEGRWESGASQSQWGHAEGLQNQTRTDFFLNPELEISETKTGLGILFSFRETGPFFENPSAQTLRIDGDRPSGFLSWIQNNQKQRPQAMLDRIGSEGIQNQNLTLFRGRNLARFALGSPYGLATPNRRGSSLTLGWKPPETGVRFTLRAEVLDEILGEGNSAKRRFQLVSAQTSLHLEEGLGWDKKFRVNGFFTRESSERGGNLPVNLTREAWEAGLLWEPFRNCDLMAGWRSVRLSGNETEVMVNSFNEITGFSPVEYKETENLVGAGIQFHFNPQCFVMISAFGNALENQSPWEIRQIYSNFSFRF